jgi:hypothetical protein
MIDVRNRQRPLVCIELLTWQTTLQSALGAFPTGFVFDAGRDPIPIVGILGSVHWH